MKTNILSLPITEWVTNTIPKETTTQAIEALESGKVLYFPNLSFSIPADEYALLTPTCLAPNSKNVSFNPANKHLGGTVLQGEPHQQLHNMLRRYANLSQSFLHKMIPHYISCLYQARTSYRPAQIDGRKLSPRKDDTRLHVDAFPATPTQGNRILRIFSNVNPHNEPRVWRIGDTFSNVTAHFLPRISRPIPGTAKLLQWLKITKSYRTPYDHYMLHLHDQMKEDNDYQKSVPQETFNFPPGSTWIVFTDQVSHAAMSGQYLFEQTFHLPMNGLLKPHTAPLQVLENNLQRKLV